MHSSDIMYSVKYSIVDTVRICKYSTLYFKILNFVLEVIHTLRY